MSDARELLIKLTVDAQQAQARLKSIEGQTKSMASSMKSAQGNINDLAGAFNKLKVAAAAIGSVVAVFQSFKFAIDAKDQIDQLEGSFKALLGSGERAADMMQRVFGVVKATGADLKSSGEAIQRLSIAMVDMGASNAQISQVAESFIKLGRVGGSSMQDISGALLQFTQGLSSGRLQGDELRSIMERVPGVIKVIAKEMGVSAGEVRKLGSEGKITADIMANALLNAAKDINGQFEQLPETSQQAFNRMQAEAITFGKALNDALNLSGAWTAILKASATGFQTLTEWAKDFGVALRQGWVDYQKSVLSFVERFPKGLISRLANVEELRKNIDSAEKETTRYINAVSAVKSVSDEFSKNNKLVSAIGKANDKLSEFQKLVQSMTEELNKLIAGEQGPLTKVAEIQAKLAAGTLKLSEAEKAHVLAIAANIDAQKSKNEAIKEAIKLQQEQAKEAADEIEREAESIKKLYEEAQKIWGSVDPIKAFHDELANLEKLKPYLPLEIYYAKYEELQNKLEDGMQKIAGVNEKQQDQWKDLTDAVNGYAKSMAGAFVDAVAAGENFGQTMKNALGNVLKQMAQMVIQMMIIEPMIKSLKSAMSGSGGFGGFLGSLFKFAKGGAFTGATGLPHGVYDRPTYFNMPGNGGLRAFARGGVLGEAGPEAIMPLSRDRSGNLGVTAAPVNVQVNNYTDAEVTVTEEDDQINITIGRVVEGIIKGGSRISRALESTYGLGRHSGAT